MDQKAQGSGEGGPPANLLALFEDLRRTLLETRDSNPLLGVDLDSTQIVTVTDGRSDEVYWSLGEESLRFEAAAPDPEARSPEPAGDDAGATEEGSGDQLTGSVLRSGLSPRRLRERLTDMERRAQTEEEESGVNVLHLVAGLLSWIDDKEILRKAPLLLIPVELLPDDVGGGQQLRRRDEDVSLNPLLQHRVRTSFGIRLPELEVAEGFRPSHYFDLVEREVRGRDGWRVERDALLLGLFAFDKELMYRDLDPGAWPEDALIHHPLVRGLLLEGFPAADRLPDGNLDELLPPDKIFHVVDADAAQARVIEEVRAGRSLLVRGPPGTGKSQTITNIIAAEVQAGHRVLFLAEKSAALSVVHDRLRKAGLRDICLELHARKARKADVIHELERTLKAGAPDRKARVPASLESSPEDSPLKASRDRLNELATLLHRPIGSSGETPYRVLGRLSVYEAQKIPVRRPSLAPVSLTSMSRKEEDALAETLQEYGARLEEDGAPPNPFEGAGNLDLSPSDRRSLVQTMDEAREKLEALDSTLRETLQTFELQQEPTLGAIDPLLELLDRVPGLTAGDVGIARRLLRELDIGRVQKTLAAGAAWRAACAEAEDTFREAAFREDFSRLRGPLSATEDSFLTPLRPEYRAARETLASLLVNGLPRTSRERVELLHRLAPIYELRSGWEADREHCRGVLAKAWRDDRTDFARLAQVADWCLSVSTAVLQPSGDRVVDLAVRPGVAGQLRTVLAEKGTPARAALADVVQTLALDPKVFGEKGQEGAPLADIVERLQSMIRADGRYGCWQRLVPLRQRLKEAGLGDLEERMRKGEMDASAAVTELRFERARQLWALARAEHPALNRIAPRSRGKVVEDFAKQDRQLFQENADAVLRQHRAQLPDEGGQGGMRVLRSQFLRQTGHLALRQLFEKAGSTIQRIKPVLLMSPLSVAQLLPRGKVSFDLLIIDEASQVRPEDAFGAIARATRLVVVGDREQLPPSSFFKRQRRVESDEVPGNGEDPLGGADRAQRLESILTLCEARGFPARTLTGHYRSWHPSLIEVSNREFYHGELWLPPSPLPRGPHVGLSLTRVNGEYRDQVNRREAKVIVDRVAKHASDTPGLSLGIATFSGPQCKLILDLLDKRRRRDPALDRLMRAGPEELFVKNLENVQGDERDVILISVGYGPAVRGERLGSMNFGPVSHAGGERRLNVLFTRARARCEVFASFDPSDIDPRRVTNDGPGIFRRWLMDANSATQHKAPIGSLDPLSLESDVANAIRELKYVVDPWIGTDSFRIDLAVRHPEKPDTYILAVECDGSAYRDAPWVRERDRQRREVLENMGWRHHRIWSHDWYNDPEWERKELRDALEAALQASESGVRIAGANEAKGDSEPGEGEPVFVEAGEFLPRKPPGRRALRAKTKSRRIPRRRRS